MPESDDIELVEHDGEHHLRLPGVGLYALDRVQLYRLAQIGMQITDQVAWDEPPVPPYVVTVDFGEDEDDGHDWTWRVRTDDRKLAWKLKEAVNTEMERVSNLDCIATIPAFPAQHMLNVEDVESVAEALVSLRVVLVTIEGGVIEAGIDRDYWRKSGFTATEERDALSECFNDGVFDDAVDGSDLEQLLDAWIEDTDEEDLVTMAGDDHMELFYKLRRWIRGEDLTKGG